MAGLPFGAYMLMLISVEIGWGLGGFITGFLPFFQELATMAVVALVFCGICIVIEGITYLIHGDH